MMHLLIGFGPSGRCALCGEPVAAHCDHAEHADRRCCPSTMLEEGDAA